MPIPKVISSDQQANVIESGQAEEMARLRLLEAVAVGEADMKAGRSRRFNSTDELSDYLDAQAASTSSGLA